MEYKNMSISSSNTADTITLKISGRFDFSTHKEFRIALNTITSATKHGTVDLRSTEYLDSSALGMLLMLRSKMDNDKSRVSIINSPPEVKKILNMASFDQLFTLT